MAASCDMAKERLTDCRYFFEIVHGSIKTDLMRKKVASCYIQMILIVCCFLLTGPNREKIISVSCVIDGVFWVCITLLWLSKLKNFLFFCLLDRKPHFILFLMLVWWCKNRYKINYSHFSSGGWCGVLKWCNVWAHKRTISVNTIDFWPTLITLMYQSTSADLQQKCLTIFPAL